MLMPVIMLMPVLMTTTVPLIGRPVIVRAVRVAVLRAALCRLPGVLVSGVSGHQPRSLDVATLAEIAGCRPTVASQHLSKLRFGGLVEATRDGRRMIYRLRGAHVRALLAEAIFQADHQVSGLPTHD
jgi:DNA-binding transcriptional ArsR family regulator